MFYFLSAPGRKVLGCGFRVHLGNVGEKMIHDPTDCAQYRLRRGAGGYIGNGFDIVYVTTVSADVPAAITCSI